MSGATVTPSNQGWHALDRRLAKGDTLVIVSIDRIGRNRLNIMSSIRDLVGRSVRIRSLSPAESAWAVYPGRGPRKPRGPAGGRAREFLFLERGAGTPPHPGEDRRRQEAGRSPRSHR